MDIKLRTGLGLATVWRWVQNLRESKEIYLHHKEIHPNGGPLISVYYPGKRPPKYSARVPKVATSKERAARNRKAMRASGDWEDVKARRRAQYHANKKPRRDALTAALYGDKR